MATKPANPIPADGGGPLVTLPWDIRYMVYDLNGGFPGRFFNIKTNRKSLKEWQKSRSLPLLNAQAAPVFGPQIEYTPVTLEDRADLPRFLHGLSDAQLRSIGRTWFIGDEALMKKILSTAIPGVVPTTPRITGIFPEDLKVQGFIPAFRCGHSHSPSDRTDGTDEFPHFNFERDTLYLRYKTFWEYSGGKTGGSAHKNTKRRDGEEATGDVIRAWKRHRTPNKHMSIRGLMAALRLHERCHGQDWQRVRRLAILWPEQPLLERDSAAVEAVLADILVFFPQLDRLTLVMEHVYWRDNPDDMAPWALMPPLAMDVVAALERPRPDDPPNPFAPGTHQHYMYVLRKKMLPFPSAAYVGTGFNAMFKPWQPNPLVAAGLRYYDQHFPDQLLLLDTAYYFFNEGYNGGFGGQHQHQQQSQPEIQPQIQPQLQPPQPQQPGVPGPILTPAEIINALLPPSAQGQGVPAEQVVIHPNALRVHRLDRNLLAAHLDRLAGGPQHESDNSRVAAAVVWDQPPRPRPTVPAKIDVKLAVPKRTKGMWLDTLQYLRELAPEIGTEFLQGD